MILSNKIKLSLALGLWWKSKNYLPKVGRDGSDFDLLLDVAVQVAAVYINAHCRKSI